MPRWPPSAYMRGSSKVALKKEVVERLAAYEEAVDLLRLHVLYTLRKNRVLPPEELPHRVTGRVKSIDSIFRKIKQIEREEKTSIKKFSDIKRHVGDIAGVRVVCNYLDDVLLIYGYLDRHPAFNIVRTQVENLIERPKDGYRGLHIPIQIHTNYGKVKSELQIRTSLQDSWATKDHSLRYKLSVVKKRRIPSTLGSLMEALSDQLHNLDKMFINVSQEIRRVVGP